jgi:ribose/xylose/arabinose/galactoside ABC-type transport system permease subunit
MIFRSLSRHPVAGLPLTFIIAGLAATAVGLAIGYTPGGRNLYALGSNPEAARFAGIPTEKTVFSALMLVGAAARRGRAG